MRLWTGVLGVGFLGMSFLNYVLYQDISVLRKKVTTLQRDCAPMTPTAPITKNYPPRPLSAKSALAPTKKEAPTKPTKEGWDEESFLSRAKSRRVLLERVASLVGRSEHETEEAYLARMTPLITMALQNPRLYIEDLKSYAEQTAGLTDAQDTELSKIFEDAQNEAIALINKAVAEGALTPYEVNLSGALQVAGEAGAILQKAEENMRAALRPEQLAAMKEAGFELGEYLAITAPWETLQPPPTSAPRLTE